MRRTVKLEFKPEAEVDAAGVRVGNGYWEDEQVLTAPTWMASDEGFMLPAIMEVSVARVMEEEEDRIRFSFRSRSVMPLGEEETAYSALDEPVAQMTAEKPGSAGDEDRFHEGVRSPNSGDRRASRRREPAGR